MKIASAPGKVILFGEHAVVYPNPEFPNTNPHTGIAAAIGRRAYASAEKTSDKRVLIYTDKDGRGEKEYSYSLESLMEMRKRFREYFDDLNKLNRIEGMKGIHQNDPDGVAPVAVVLAEVLNDYGFDGMRVRIKSQIPPRSHLGSGSSAFAAVAGAAILECGGELDKEKVSRLAHYGDCLLVGAPSGIDNITVSYGGYVKFKKTGPLSKEIKQLDIGKRFNLVVCNSGVPSDTGDVVRFVKRRIKSHEKGVGRRDVLKEFDIINQICEDGERALREGNLKKLGYNFWRNQAFLKNIGVSHGALDYICDIINELAIDSKAYGSKMTGAGWGGCAIAAAEDTGLVEKILKDCGFDAFIAELGCEGVKEEKEFPDF